MNDNPYVTVGSPDYSTPVLNMFGDQPKPQAKPGQQQQQQQQQSGQPNFFQMLMKLFGQNGQPMPLGADQMNAGNPGGTAGVLPGIY